MGKKIRRPILLVCFDLAVLESTHILFLYAHLLKERCLTTLSSGSLYVPTNIVLIAFFNYYYTFLQLDPDDVSEQLKRQGASIPLVRPGKSTATYIKTVISCTVIYSAPAIFLFILFLIITQLEIFVLWYFTTCELM